MKSDISDSSKPGLTNAERAWLERLSNLTGSASPGSDDSNKRSSRVPAVKALAGVKPGTVEGFGPGDIIPSLKDILGPLSATCKVSNNTDQILQLDVASLKGQPSSGEFKSPPPPEIGAKQSVEFVCVSKKIPILGISTAGAEGKVTYFFGEPKTTWTLHFDNPRVNDPFGDGNSADAPLGGANKDKYKSIALPGQGADATFQFSLSNVGGGPGPGPGPGPQPPATDVRSNCVITVTNNTKLPLTLADQGHDRGDFMTFPPPSIAPGASASFVSVETPHAKEQGCKGFVSWEIGSPAVAIWRCEWDNPESEKNSAKATAEPQTAGFRTVSQIGQDDENVPVVFTLSGGGGQTPVPPTPVPPTPVPPTPVPPEEEFNPPGAQKQPTLRRGDKSVDGWVEYLQELLNFHKAGNLVVDGDFGAATERAVVKFQQDKKLQVDRVVGNQTWAALRVGAPEKPSTDGRQPHTYEEHGAEARWDLEYEDGVYFKATDELRLFLVSVGDAKIEDFNATVRITPPNTKPSVRKFKIGPADMESPTGSGQQHSVKIAKFKKQFPASDPAAKVEEYKIEAYLDRELGGDLFTGNVREQ